MQIVGTFDPSLASEKTTYGNGNSVTQNYVRNNSQDTSRIIFKGTEDLGGGLKASFLLENDFDTRYDGTANLGSKGGEQFLALEGGFGKIAVGAPNTPSLTTQASRNPFGTKLGSGFNGVLGTGHVRNNNSLVYTTPTFAGFTAAIGYAYGVQADANLGSTPSATVAAYTAASCVNAAATSTAGATTAYPVDLNADAASDVCIKTASAVNGTKVASHTDIALKYDNGPLAAGVSFYQVAENADAAKSKAFAAGVGASSSGLAATAANKQTNVYASYDLGVAKLIAGYHTETLATDTKQKGYNVGAVVPLNANLSLLANYGKLDDQSTYNLDKTITAVGLKYSLSKNTSVYARYSDQKNENVRSDAVSTVYQVQGIKTTLVGMSTSF